MMSTLNVNLDVRLKRMFRVRVWLALLCMRAAAAVMPVNVHINVNIDPNISIKSTGRTSMQANIY